MGYLARICPEKGLHLLVDAFCRLAREPGREQLRLVTAGYLGSRDREYLARLQVQIDQVGLTVRNDSSRVLKDGYEGVWGGEGETDPSDATHS